MTDQRLNYAAVFRTREVKMTAQASDRITYRDQEFSLVGWEGASLFDPAQHNHPKGFTHPIQVFRDSPRLPIGRWILGEVTNVADLVRDLDQASGGAGATGTDDLEALALSASALDIG